MAAYVPAALVPSMTSVTSTAAYQTSTAATTGVLRTIHAQSSAAAHSITVTTGGADAAATRLFDAYALTALDSGDLQRLVGRTGNGAVVARLQVGHGDRLHRHADDRWLHLHVKTLGLLMRVTNAFEQPQVLPR